MFRSAIARWVGFAGFAVLLLAPPAFSQNASLPLFTLFGTVSRLDTSQSPSALQFWVQSPDSATSGALLSLGLTPSAHLVKDGYPIRSINLRPGDIGQAQVALQPDGSWRLLALDADTPQPRRYFTGLLTAVQTGGDHSSLQITLNGPAPQTQEIPFDAATLFRQDGSTTDPSALHTGWLASVLAAVAPDGGLVAVRVDEVPPVPDHRTGVSGIVSDIDLGASTLWIRRSTGQDVRIRLAANTVWHPSPRRYVLAQLQIGDEAIATGSSDTDGSIRATSVAAWAPDIDLIFFHPALYHILEVDAASSQMIVQGFNGAVETVEIAPAAILIRDGAYADLSSFQPGDGISLRGFALATGGWSGTYAEASSSH